MRRLDSDRNQAERLVPMIGDLMAAAAVPFTSLERIAVCVGPGGFSGIRTGVAAARGIGLAADIPVVGATSFRIMAAAFELSDDAPDVYGLVAPAGSSAVYCQLLGRGTVTLTDIVALPQSEIGAFFAGRAEVLTGPAAAPLSAGGYVSSPVKAAALVPDAVTLAAIAPDLVPERDLPSPCYVRRPDAKPQTRHLIPRTTVERAAALPVTLAVPEDASQLAAVHADALPPGWSAAELAGYCGAEERIVLKASEGAVVHGFVVLQLVAGEAEILTVAVREQKRREGIASSLIDAAIELCRAKLISCIYLEVAHGNCPALSLYEKFGFRAFASRKNYYQSAEPAARTAHIMRLDTTGSAAS